LLLTLQAKGLLYFTYWDDPDGQHYGTVRIFRQKFTREDAIEFHAFAPLEALPCV
jgi:hypothetical protein